MHWFYFTPIALIPLFAFMNRCRGGAIEGSVPFISLALCILTFIAFEGVWTPMAVGLAVGVMYNLFERLGWGDWVGECSDTKSNVALNTTDEGQNNGIRFLASICTQFTIAQYKIIFFNTYAKWVNWIKMGYAWVYEKITKKEMFISLIDYKPMYFNNWLWYCRVALFFRGMYWWGPTVAPLYLLGVDGVSLVIATIAFGLSFPIAAELGYQTTKRFNFPKLQLRSGWEWQELYYGAFHGLILSVLYITFKLGIVWKVQL